MSFSNFSPRVFCQGSKRADAHQCLKGCRCLHQTWHRASDRNDHGRNQSRSRRIYETSRRRICDDPLRYALSQLRRRLYDSIRRTTVFNWAKRGRTDSLPSFSLLLPSISLASPPHFHCQQLKLCVTLAVLTMPRSQSTVSRRLASQKANSKIRIQS